MWYQTEITLPPFERGFHIITEVVLKGIREIENIKLGTLQIFIKHTSASLTINEDADPTVRSDFESHFNITVPENAPYYKHTIEGSDDMPAHLKASILGIAKVLYPNFISLFDMYIFPFYLSQSWPW